MDKDYFKQNSGPRQGNIHAQSDKGQNEEDHAGTTLNKSEQIFWNHNEHLISKEKRDESSGEEKEDTIGIP